MYINLYFIYLWVLYAVITDLCTWYIISLLGSQLLRHRSSDAGAVSLYLESSSKSYRCYVGRQLCLGYANVMDSSKSHINSLFPNIIVLIH